MKVRRPRHGWLAPLLILCAVALLPGPASAQPQPFPNRPLSIISPFPPGNFLDIMMRSVGERLSPRLGQPVLVQNRPGGSDVVATQALLAAPPDGHTMIVATSNMTSNPVTIKLSYQLTDFTILAMAWRAKYFIVVRSNLPATTITEFIALAKQQPERLNFAYITSMRYHITDLSQRVGMSLLQVPFQSQTVFIPRLLDGQIDAAFMGPYEAVAQAKGGKVRILASTAPQRTKDYPDVPTVSETVPGFDYVGLTGFATLSKVPPAVTMRLSTEIRDIMRSPESAKQLEGAGYDYTDLSMEEITKMFRDRAEMYARIGKQLGIVPE